MFSIHDEARVKELLVTYGHKPFRYGQIENAIYKNFSENYTSIETLPKEIRALLEEHCFFTTLTLSSEITSPDKQTTKLLFSTHDNLMIEAVIMRHLSGRNTLCVSSQVGCPMACVFCATGKL